MTYKTFVTVAPRFTRAVNVERDRHVSGAVNGYVLTSTAEGILGRVAAALRAPAGHRAWTLTGPYGSGKSAFAVFLGNLLGSSKEEGGRIARRILQSRNEALFREYFDRRKRDTLATDGFCPIILTGAPEPLELTILRAGCRDIRRYCAHGRPPSVLKRLDDLLDEAKSGARIAVNDLADCLSSAADSLQRTGRSQGILLVVDELGRFLEFVAREPDRGDIHSLQVLAEETARSRIPGFLFFTVLHQSFDRYVEGFRPSVRDEWSKVQGRFEDVAFQEPPEEFIGLLAQAIVHAEGPLTTQLHREARELGERAYKLGLAPRGMNKAEFLRLTQRCAPLHPLTVLVLARLCRKFGQNQRSLFSFLVSREPHAFSTFLETEFKKSSAPFYTLDRLYDYAVQAIGSGLSVGESSTRWAQVQSTLERCAGTAPEETRLIKAIGLLTATGAYGNLKSSPAVVEFACDSETSNPSRVAEGLRKRSVLVYRKHSDSLGLWEGSDVDIDSRLLEAQKTLPPSTSVALKLRSLWTPRPHVAKSHSIRTGTLRYFVSRFVDMNQLTGAVEQGEDADGVLLYALPNSSADFDELVRLAASPALKERADVLVAIPKDIDALQETVRELELLRWVDDNTPELHGDSVARRELRARLLVADREVGF